MADGSETGAESAVLTAKPPIGGTMIGPQGQALKYGNPGNKGGTGRPRERIRQNFRDILENHGMSALIDILTAPRAIKHTCTKCGHSAIIEGSTVGDQERLKAADIAARYGVGTQQEVEHQGTVKLAHSAPIGQDRTD